MIKNYLEFNEALSNVWLELYQELEKYPDVFTKNKLSNDKIAFDNFNNIMSKEIRYNWKLSSGISEDIDFTQYNLDLIQEFNMHPNESPNFSKEKSTNIIGKTFAYLIKYLMTQGSKLSEIKMISPSELMVEWFELIKKFYMVLPKLKFCGFSRNYHWWETCKFVIQDNKIKIKFLGNDFGNNKINLGQYLGAGVEKTVNIVQRDGKDIVIKPNTLTKAEIKMINENPDLFAKIIFINKDYYGQEILRPMEVKNEIEINNLIKKINKRIHPYVISDIIRNNVGYDDNNNLKAFDWKLSI